MTEGPRALSGADFAAAPENRTRRGPPPGDSLLRHAPASVSGRKGGAGPIEPHFCRSDNPGARRKATRSSHGQVWIGSERARIRKGRERKARQSQVGSWMPDVVRPRPRPGNTSLLGGRTTSGPHRVPRGRLPRHRPAPDYPTQPSGFLAAAGITFCWKMPCVSCRVPRRRRHALHANAAPIPSDISPTTPACGGPRR